MTMLFLGACVAIGLASTAGAPVQGTQLSDPAVDAYVEFVKGRPLNAPADRKFILAGLDRLASAVEGLALRKIGLDAEVLSVARKVRYELRQLEPYATDTPERLRNRWKVFKSAAKAIDDLADELDSRVVDKALRAAVVRAADSIDYDDPARWQPEAVELFFDLAARALLQMATAGPKTGR